MTRTMLCSETAYANFATGSHADFSASPMPNDVPT